MPRSLEGLLTGFDCIADENAELLILGSMPGVASLDQQEYYAHPRNSFWKIMQALYGIPFDADYSQRLELLKRNKIALWDVAHQCVRSGSLDSNIKADSVQVNDFKALFKFTPNIKKVYFNGGKSADLYTRKVMKEEWVAALGMKYVQLPSTSPANARLTLEQKITAWQQLRV